jgi:hypothetical protein
MGTCSKPQCRRPVTRIGRVLLCDDHFKLHTAMQRRRAETERQAKAAQAGKHASRMKTQTKKRRANHMQKINITKTHVEAVTGSGATMIPNVGSAEVVKILNEIIDALIVGKDQT